MATYSFDGVDIALEFPDADVPDDRAALTTLLEVWEEFVKKKEHFFLFRK
jgi:chitinase